MSQLKNAVYSMLLVAVSTGIIGLLVPNGEMKKSIRIVCGLVLSVVLLSPMKPLIQALTQMEAVYENTDETENRHSVYDAMVQQHKKVLEERLSVYLEEEWGINDTTVGLSVDGSDPKAIVILSANVLLPEEIGEERKMALCDAMKAMLECEVRVIARHA